MGHGGNLYVEQLHVPLVIWPVGGEGAGRRVGTPVSNREIAPTVADLALGRPDDHPFGGRSLSRFWRDGTAEVAGTAIAAAASTDGMPAGPATTQPVFSGVHGETSNPDARIRFGNMTSVVFGSLHYILDGAGVEELYDLVTDPRETADLAGNPDRQEVLSAIRELLASHLEPEWRSRK